MLSGCEFFVEVASEKDRGSTEIASGFGWVYSRFESALGVGEDGCAAEGMQASGPEGQRVGSLGPRSDTVPLMLLGWWSPKGSKQQKGERQRGRRALDQDDLPHCAHSADDAHTDDEDEDGRRA